MLSSRTALEDYLDQHDDHAWHPAAGLLEAETHDVDRTAARERRRLRGFGYIDTDAPHPVIRLACQARATGAISIVIPPWTGVFGAVLAADASHDADLALAGAR
jgi:hypothetical protein